MIQGILVQLNLGYRWHEWVKWMLWWRYWLKELNEGALKWGETLDLCYAALIYHYNVLGLLSLWVLLIIIEIWNQYANKNCPLSFKLYLYVVVVAENRRNSFQSLLKWHICWHYIFIHFCIFWIWVDWWILIKKISIEKSATYGWLWLF